MRLIGMRISGCYALTAAILLSALFSKTPVHAAASWNVQTVDSNAAAVGNGYCPIAVDSSGSPHIAYTRDVGLGYYDPVVMYARWNSALGSFSIQQIATGQATDIALDTHNNPNILYGLFAEGFKYASWTGLNWTIQTVDTTYAVYAALALDSHGNPHAAYSTGTTLKYASRSGSTWTTETVETGTGIPFYLSFALDSNDKPYILYSNPAKKIATLEKSGWNIQNANLSDTMGGVGNMALDSKGHPHFIYRVGSIDDTTIKYASWTGFSWKTQTVASGFRIRTERIGFLVIDSLDYPHISYASQEGVMYAGWTGVTWNLQAVAPAGNWPPYPPTYLAVDSNRIPHISYYPDLGLGPSHSTSVMYAAATEPVLLYSPLALQLVLVAVAIISAAVIVYLWRKK